MGPAKYNNNFMFGNNAWSGTIIILFSLAVSLYFSKCLIPSLLKTFF